MTKSEQWRARLSRHEASTESVASFCAREGFSTASYYAWRRRLRQHRFVEVEVAAARVLLVEVGGARISVPTDFDPVHLRAVVGALQ